MYRIVLLLSFFTLAAAAVTAQSSDYAEVERTVRYYLDGGTNNDFATLKKAFHAEATMEFIGEAYTRVNVLEFFGARMKPGPKSNRTTRVAHIDVSGNAATAKLEIDYPSFSFVDYMTLLKIDGEWKIVSKVFYRRAKPAPEKE